ncbi:16S rRNA (guanine(966)-N(2))-methyltransferase RsmD [Alloalcanivorax xenomutans]|jgi:16S rRNA (guanine966-N2)-methyltransferase|uniref:16S rRNA (guanine(966)-N(2))-methyltransferase RsmD n=1 Tax=Alloalcanivorax xenomutans TaxID=1094342 RepID=UPI000E237012|nr:16S rRNA (guanine(966)-N(2))-methyltransferase RsmD [Alloalcanivorax xenomutans]MCE7525045.1 16S rRNA (guanine(966)-N(2))-methyltransferase RsmD [Alloalcanivorax xenomutans]WOA31721.1 16S rRNA (guanine(966)-N(2))-methyltransferase RsmD [Alloalcanivorax xenomutans]
MKAKGKTSKGQVRIIGGEFRGHRLHFVDQGGDLRPSGDRLRETLFNWLQWELSGARVLDLFAGSGALGAEALSRGAERAILVEKKKERCSDLSRQLRPLFGERVVIQCADALKWLPRTAERFDLVFVDPPYDLGLAEPACRALEDLKLLMPEALIYVESRRQDGAPEVPENWRLLKEKSGGDVLARLFQRE